MPHIEPVKMQRRMLREEERPTLVELEAIERFRPRMRGDCIDGPRPCPWIGCKFHLGIDVKSNGTIVVNYDAASDEGKPTCALDVADQQGLTLESVGGLLNVSREWIRKLEEGALIKLRDGLRGGER